VSQVEMGISESKGGIEIISFFSSDFQIILVIVVSEHCKALPCFLKIRDFLVVTPSSLLHIHRRFHWVRTASIVTAE
jgi:hypothetical protein